MCVRLVVGKTTDVGLRLVAVSRLMDGKEPAFCARCGVF